MHSASVLREHTMREFRKKQDMKRALYSKPVLIFLGVILIFLIYSTWNIYTKAMVPYENRVNAEKKLTDLQEREMELTSRIKTLETEEGVEIEVREKFGLVREGEEVVVILEDEVGSGATESEHTNSSLWQKILGALGL